MQMLCTDCIYFLVGPYNFQKKELAQSSEKLVRMHWFLWCHIRKEVMCLAKLVVKLDRLTQWVLSPVQRTVAADSE